MMKLQGGKQEMLKVEMADSNGKKVNKLSLKSNSKLRELLFFFPVCSVWFDANTTVNESETNLL